MSIRKQMKMKMKLSERVNMHDDNDDCDPILKKVSFWKSKSDNK